MQGEISLLELLEGVREVRKFFSSYYYQYLCNAAILYLKGNDMIVDFNDRKKDYKQLEEVCPEFVKWIKKVGQKLYDEEGLGMKYNLGETWELPYIHDRDEILDKKIKQLQRKKEKK